MRVVELQDMSEKRKYMHLLLDADPSEKMVMRYLPRGRMFLLEEDGALGEIVVVDLGDRRCEIKNLAVAPGAQGSGLGRLLVEQAAGSFGGAYRDMLVGTSEKGRRFYEKCGFSFSHRAPEFFLRNYPEPIFEDGKQCVDMLYLRRAL